MNDLFLYHPPDRIDDAPRYPYVLRYPHIAGMLFGVPLAIHRQKLDVILKALGPRFGLDDLPDIESAAGFSASTVRDRPYSVSADGIATIPIMGTLVNRGSMMDAASGLTSYAQIQHQFESAVSDPKVRGILLDVDSGGGQCNGMLDLSDAVYAARGSKPIYAVANDACFSAAYGIASAADKLFVSRTAGVGSIGVIATLLDQSGADEKAGLKYETIFEGDHKADLNPHEPVTDDARSMIRAEMKRINGMFHATVARNRRLSASDVKDMQASSYFGEHGVTNGLADQIGTPADALSELAGAIKSHKKTFAVAASSAANSTKGALTMEQKYLALSTAEILEINDICAIARLPISAATAYIRRGLTPQAVRREILESTTTEQVIDIEPSNPNAAGYSVSTPRSLEESPMVKAAMARTSTEPGSTQPNAYREECARLGKPFNRNVN